MVVGRWDNCWIFFILFLKHWFGGLENGLGLRRSCFFKERDSRVCCVLLVLVLLLLLVGRPLVTVVVIVRLFTPRLLYGSALLDTCVVTLPLELRVRRERQDTLHRFTALQD